MAGIDKLTLDVAMTSLDALWVRQQLIAQNVANAKVDGYAAQRLNFEQVMSDMADRLDDGEFQNANTELVDEAKAALEVREDESPVQIDTEMSDLVLNGIRYQAILTGLGRLSELNHIALSSGGK